jgi:hypothetical protein
MIRILLFLHLVAAFSVAQVQEPAINRGAPAAWQALLRLQTTASVLHITAHPDDEDGALLTWLTRSQGVRTGLLTLNRGEGGANLAGPELYDSLGILRTEEAAGSRPLLRRGAIFHSSRGFRIFQTSGRNHGALGPRKRAARCRACDTDVSPRCHCLALSR